MSERKWLFMLDPEQAKVFVRLMADAEAGDGAAACRLRDMHREALGGLRYSPKQAFYWCAQSYPKAVKWYRLAAAQRLGTASMNLGYCCLQRHGVPADKGDALEARTAPRHATSD